MAAPITAPCPESGDTAALFALDALEGAEAAAFRTHLADCPTCQRTVADDRAALAAVALAVPEVSPSPGFRERLLQRGAAEIAGAAPRPPAPILPFRPRQEAPLARAAALRAAPRAAWSLPLAAAFAVSLLAGALVGAASEPRQVVAAAVLRAEGGTGTATVIVRRSGETEVRLEGLADPPPGRVYEAWVIPPGGAPIPAGTTDRGTASLRLTTPVPVQGGVVAFTIEAAPGADAPTSPPILAGAVGT